MAYIRLSWDLLDFCNETLFLFLFCSIMFHALLVMRQAHQKKRWIYCKGRGRGKLLDCHQLLEILYCYDKVRDYLFVFGLSIKYFSFLNILHFHLTRSFMTYQLRTLDFWFPEDNLWIQRPLEFHGHGSWSVCKAALSQYLYAKMQS